MVFSLSLSDAESFAFVLSYAILTALPQPAVLYFPTKIRLQKPRKYAEFNSGGVRPTSNQWDTIFHWFFLIRWGLSFLLHFNTATSAALGFYYVEGCLHRTLDCYFTCSGGLPFPEAKPWRPSLRWETFARHFPEIAKIWKSKAWTYNPFIFDDRYILFVCKNIQLWKDFCF